MIKRFAKLKPASPGVYRVAAVATFSHAPPAASDVYIPLPQGISEQDVLGMWVVDGQWMKEMPPGGDTYEYPSLLWSGHLYDLSGYANANRQILFRVANQIKVSVMTTGFENCHSSVDQDTRKRIDSFRAISVSRRAPLLRFFGPDYQGEKHRYRIIWTMMETYKIHKDMVDLINNYDELWTPTEWNRRVFEESGVKILTKAMPLGVDPEIYKPIPNAKLPKCRLITTDKAGTMAVPSGFTFFSVGLPSFRKGFDVLSEAFDLAFRDRKDVNLVLGITHSLPEWNAKVYAQLRECRSQIWTLEGRYSDHELAQFYSACNAYVSASRGEGWNLPACEAAACGIPVIVPDNTCHADVVGNDGFMFPIEGIAVHQEANTVSPWYVDMPFAVFGKKSVEKLAELLRFVEEGSKEVRDRTARLQETMRTRWTWDEASKSVVNRVLEVQP